MDVHFVLPKDSEKKEKTAIDPVQINRFLKRLIPVFFLSAILPMFLFLVSFPSDLQFLTRAGKKPELRIWTEPSQILVDKNRELELNVYAQYESESLLPGVSLIAKSDGLDVSGDITYLKPFRGQVKLGTLIVNSGSQSGKFVIAIPGDSVEIAALNSPLEIITGTTTIYVQ